MNFRQVVQRPAAMLLTLIATASLANAQVPQKHPTVNHRLVQQHKRIVAGVQSHHLTPHQAAKLHAADARIHRQEMVDRSRHHGALTVREKKHLNRELSHVNHKITHEKHPG